MPMDFPDLVALRGAFDHPKMLPYRDGETEAAYRERCAVWSEERWHDYVQAREIRSGKGWDKDDPRAALADMFARRLRRP